MHQFLASILWPNQDEEEAVLRAQLEKDMMLASGGDSNDITTSGDSGSSKTSQTAEDKSTMKIFRMKGILSVQHTVNEKDGIVMLYGDNDEDAAFHDNYLDATLG
eukprot:10468760-Ditylum_brightwellii.AAC.1